MFYVLAGMIGFGIGASAIWYLLHYGYAMNDLVTHNNEDGYEIRHHKIMRVTGVYSKSIVYSNGTKVTTPEYLHSHQAAGDIAEWLKKDE